MNELVSQHVFDGLQQVGEERSDVCCNQNSDDYKGDVLNSKLPEQLIFLIIDLQEFERSVNIVTYSIWVVNWIDQVLWADADTEKVGYGNNFAKIISETANESLPVPQLLLPLAVVHIVSREDLLQIIVHTQLLFAFTYFEADRLGVELSQTLLHIVLLLDFFADGAAKEPSGTLEHETQVSLILQFRLLCFLDGFLILWVLSP